MEIFELLVYAEPETDTFVYMNALDARMCITQVEITEILFNKTGHTFSTNIQVVSKRKQPLAS